MRIAITGANGFVGSRLTRFLMNKGHDVTALVRHNANLSLLPVKSHIVEFDCTSVPHIKQTLEGMDIVIHCAASVRTLNWECMQESNVSYTERIVEAVNETQSIKQLIFMSSQAAAGMGEKHKPRTEEDLPKPVTWYGKSKLMAEEIIRSRCLKDWTIIRPVSVFGPGDKDFLQTFKLMKNHLSLSLGLRDKYISIIYVDDLCSMIELCLLNEKASKQVFFASDGMVYTHRMFMNALQNAIHTVSLHIPIPDALLFYTAAIGEIKSQLTKKIEIVNLQKFKEMRGRYWTVSIDKARKLLGFNPRPNLSRNLHTTWIWYKEQGWL